MKKLINWILINTGVFGYLFLMICSVLSYYLLVVLNKILELKIKIMGR